MWDFEHPPLEQVLADRYSIHRTTPAECARELSAGLADIGLIPAAAYAFDPGLAIIPGCAIASLDRVRSILLIVREGAVDRVRTVAADTSSRTSLAYAQVLFSRYWRPLGSPEVRFLQHPPDLDRMLEAADSALLIGDPALLALESQNERLQRTGERLDYLDLAHEWHQRTGLPWVSAFWAVRPSALDESGLEPAQLIADFQHSRDEGLAHIDQVVTEWSQRIAIPAETIRTYLTRNIHYILDENCIRGLESFYAAAAEVDYLPRTSTLRLL